MDSQRDRDRQLLKEWGKTLPPDLDPYRCPVCDGNVDRPDSLDARTRQPGDGWKCAIHGIVEPSYDRDRSYRLAWAIPLDEDD